MGLFDSFKKKDSKSNSNDSVVGSVGSFYRVHGLRKDLKEDDYVNSHFEPLTKGEIEYVEKFVSPHREKNYFAGEKEIEILRKGNIASNEDGRPEIYLGRFTKIESGTYSATFNKSILSSITFNYSDKSPEIIADPQQLLSISKRTKF